MEFSFDAYRLDMESCTEWLWNSVNTQKPTTDGVASDQYARGVCIYADMYVSEFACMC